MDARELRIGNWVRDRYNLTQPILVESLYEKGINISAGDDGKPYGMHSSQIEYEFLLTEIYGIPLTEEWLLKFGFQFVNERYWVNDINDWDIIVEFDKSAQLIKWDIMDFTENYITSLKYVHQLQNLFFALEEKELTITN